MNNILSFKKRLTALLSGLPLLLCAQQTIPLNDLSAWRPTGKTNWQIAGDVNADPSKKEDMRGLPGAGVLANLPEGQNKANLLSVAEYGDVDVSFDFMMAAHSNSGFYLQGRYEVQLLDSWGVKNPAYGDCGGIYKRRRLPSGELFDGHAPRLNACHAPGLWQKMEISFSAPRFDAAGNKTANAKILKVVLNGTVVQENVELTGPTGGPISEQEAAKGPFMIQGDHGPVAFRNFVVRDGAGKPAEMGPISFKTVYGQFREPSEFLNKPADSTGKTERLTWEATGRENEFAIVYNSTLKVPKAGKYRFVIQAGGHSTLRVNNAAVMPTEWRYSGEKREAEVVLPAGDLPFELIYSKLDGWMPPILAVWIEGPDFRQKAYHPLSSVLGLELRDPILLDAREPTVFRSFMDMTPAGKDKTKRIVHAVNVGSPDRLHYTYDLDNGAVAQIWKGDFLYTSPMWDDRGDGSSRPRGTVLMLEDAPLIGKTAGGLENDAPPSDAAYRPLGYDLESDNCPTFRYQLYGAEIQDQIRVVDGKYLSRTIKTKNGAPDLLCRIASGKRIAKIGDDLFQVDDKKYFLKVSAALNPRIESSGKGDVLVAPLGETVQYSVMW
jgi:Domain of Unknown Function (DUF1080)